MVGQNASHESRRVHLSPAGEESFDCLVAPAKDDEHLKRESAQQRYLLAASHGPYYSAFDSGEGNKVEVAPGLVDLVSTAEGNDAFAQGPPQKWAPIPEGCRAVLSWLAYGVQQKYATE